MSKRNILLTLLILGVIAISGYINKGQEQNQQNMTDEKPIILETQKPSNPIEIIENTIFPYPSYDDCNQYPEKYDLYDGNITLADRKCIGNINNCYFTRTKITVGISMFPTIKERNLLEMKHDDYLNNLSVGSIISYAPLGIVDLRGVGSIIHRIVGIENKAKIVYQENGERNIVEFPDNLNEFTIFYKGNNLTLKRPLYIVKGDNNNFCEIVPANTVNGVLVELIL